MSWLAILMGDDLMMGGNGGREGWEGWDGMGMAVGCLDGVMD